jgi:hypothetical protein
MINTSSPAQLTSMMQPIMVNFIRDHHSIAKAYASNNILQNTKKWSNHIRQRNGLDCKYETTRKGPTDEHARAAELQKAELLECARYCMSNEIPLSAGPIKSVIITSVVDGEVCVDAGYNMVLTRVPARNWYEQEQWILSNVRGSLTVKSMKTSAYIAETVKLFAMKDLVKTIMQYCLK